MPIPRPVQWILKTAAIIALLLCLPILVLAFPQPWFDYHEDIGSLRIYADVPFTGDRAQLASDVQHRLESMALYDRTKHKRVFLCESDRLYRLFGRCALIPAHVPGFNLSLLNNSFVSLSILGSRRIQSSGFPPNSAISGDLAHNIVHELVHDYAQESYGFWNGRGLPPWKTEGYAEYAAARALSRADTALSLAARAKLFRSGRGFLHELARQYYSWNLAVEFLAEVRLYSFEEIMHDSVAFEPTMRHLLTWADARPDTDGFVPDEGESHE